MINFLAAGGTISLGNATNLIPLVVVVLAVYFLRQKVQMGYIFLILALGIILASTTIGMDIGAAIHNYSKGYL